MIISSVTHYCYLRDRLEYLSVVQEGNKLIEIHLFCQKLVKKLDIFIAFPKSF